MVLRTLARRRLIDLDHARAYLFRAVLNESRTRLGRRRMPLTLDDAADAQMVDPLPEVLGADRRGFDPAARPAGDRFLRQANLKPERYVSTDFSPPADRPCTDVERLGQRAIQ